MISIREAVIQDKMMLKEIKPEILEHVIEERIRKQKNNEIKFLLLSDDSEPVSFVVLVFNHKVCPFLEDLYTKESARGKGYGTKLIKECENIVKQMGFSKIGLSVNPYLNSAAQNLYNKLGFLHDGKEPYLDGIYNGVEDWVIDMIKNL